MSAVYRRQEDPFTVETSGGKVILKTKTFDKAHRQAQILCCDGHDYSIWQGGRKILTYYGWKGESLRRDRDVR